MKHYFLSVIALIFLTALPARAAGFFAGPGTAISTNLSYFIAPATGGVPQVKYLNVTSDFTTSKVQFYSSAAAVLITADAAAAATAVNCTHGAITNSDVVVIRHLSGETTQRLTVASVTTTNVTFNEAITLATTTGDLLYRQSTAGSIPVGNTTKEFSNSAGIYSGTRDRPLLLSVDGTASAVVNVASGEFKD